MALHPIAVSPCRAQPYTSDAMYDAATQGTERCGYLCGGGVARQMIRALAAQMIQALAAKVDRARIQPAATSPG